MRTSLLVGVFFVVAMVIVPAAQTSSDQVSVLLKRVEALEARVALLEKQSGQAQAQVATDKWARLLVNMTPAQVVALLGKPTQRVTYSCIVPPLMDNQGGGFADCSRWLMADGGVVDFAMRTFGDEVLARWRRPGTTVYTTK